MFQFAVSAYKISTGRIVHQFFSETVEDAFDVADGMNDSDLAIYIDPSQFAGVVQPQPMLDSDHFYLPNGVPTARKSQLQSVKLLANYGGEDGPEEILLGWQAIFPEGDKVSGLVLGLGSEEVTVTGLPLGALLIVPGRGMIHSNTQSTLTFVPPVGHSMFVIEHPAYLKYNLHIRRAA